jgi:hypothetical protein
MLFRQAGSALRSAAGALVRGLGRRALALRSPFAPGARARRRLGASPSGRHAAGGDTWEVAIRRVALELADVVCRLELDAGFLLACYSGVWTKLVRREIAALTLGLEELASFEAMLPAAAAVELDEVRTAWERFRRAVAHESAVGPDRVHPHAGLAGSDAAKELLTAFRGRLVGFGRGEPERSASHRGEASGHRVG